MNKQELILVRGIPGSGKSKAAERVVRTIGENAVHLESSMYFKADDDYKFKSTQIKESHLWCLRVAKAKLLEGKTVVVANTFTRMWEMEPFLTLASNMKIPTIVLKAVGTGKNKMGVPEGTIKHMTQRWEDVPGERVLTEELLKQLTE